VFERLSDRSRRVLVLAQQESRLLGHTSIGAEHIFLGLAAEEHGVAGRVLASTGIEVARAREVLERLVGPRTPGSSPSSPSFTPTAKQALERALREAVARHAPEIGTEHLLLGVTTPGDGLVASMLGELGTQGEHVRQRLENVMAGRDPAWDGTIERFFAFLSARDWAALSGVLAPDVVRVGPLADEVSGRQAYVALLARSVPEQYANDVHRITYAVGGRSGFARVTEHLGYPDRELHLEEAYAFDLDETGLLERIEVFWQTPQLDHDVGPDAGART
jgi:Clp amino terminal domain, pathogenicity island component/SnoaL-like domain